MDQKRVVSSLPLAIVSQMSDCSKIKFLGCSQYACDADRLVNIFASPTLSTFAAASAFGAGRNLPCSPQPAPRSCSKICRLAAGRRRSDRSGRCAKERRQCPRRRGPKSPTKGSRSQGDVPLRRSDRAIYFRPSTAPIGIRRSGKKF